MKKIILSFVLSVSSMIAVAQSITISPTSLDDQIITNYGSSLPTLSGRSIGGTASSPTATPADNALLYLGGKGYTGIYLTPNPTAAIGFYANQTFASTAQGSLIKFFTTANNTVGSYERMRIAHDGKVGIGTTSPESNLHILKGSGAGAVTVGVSPLLTLENSGESYINLLTPLTNESGILFGSPNGYSKGKMNFVPSTNSIHFGTNDLTRMTINGGGSVGIGTSSPSTLLDIYESYPAAATYMVLHNVTNSSSTGIQHRADGKTWIFNNVGGAGLSIFTYNAPIDIIGSDLNFKTNSTTRIAVLNNGNVGIGIATADTKLHVAGADNDGITSTLKITSNSQNMLIDGNEIDAINSAIYINDNTANNVILATGGGNVGIGTTSPNNKLDVLGIIRSTEVLVETGWADYVFEPEFKLKTLEEVENFIKLNKHLPDILPASTIKEKGLPVAAMTTKMMQKIEELTLYIIEQDKKILEIQKQLLNLKKD